MRSIPEQRIAEFQEQDYQLYFGISKLEFDRMLQALHEAYRQERTLLNADILQTSVTCVYKTN